MASGQLLAEFGPGGEVSGQLLLEGERVGIGRPRFLEPASVAEQDSQVVMASGQMLAELEPGGKVRGQLFIEDERVGIGCLCCLQLSKTLTHQSDAQIALGADRPALGVVSLD